ECSVWPLPLVGESQCLRANKIREYGSNGGTGTICERYRSGPGGKECDFRPCTRSGWQCSNECHSSSLQVRLSRRSPDLGSAECDAAEQPRRISATVIGSRT